METSQRMTKDGFKLRRQQAFSRYVVGFVNLERKGVIEMHEGQHVRDPGIG